MCRIENSPALSTRPKLNPFAKSWDVPVYGKEESSSSGQSSSSSVVDFTERDLRDHVPQFYPSQSLWSGKMRSISENWSDESNFLDSNAFGFDEDLEGHQTQVKITHENIGCFLVEIAVEILENAPHHILKAVDLANSLKKKVGRKQLSVIKKNFGGLLTLLEGYPQIFIVHRIPKNDTVELSDNYLEHTKLLQIFDRACTSQVKVDRTTPFLDIDKMLNDLDTLYAEANDFGILPPEQFFAFLGLYNQLQLLPQVGF